MSFSTILGLIVLAFLIFMILNRHAVAKIMTALSAQLGKFGHAAATKDPLAMYQHEIEEATQKLRAGKESLVKLKTAIKSTERDLAQSHLDKERCESRIRSYVAENNEPLAQEYALKLDHIEQRIAASDTRLATQRRSFEAFEEQIQDAQKKIMEAKRDAGDLAADLDMSATEAELGDLKGVLTNANPLDEAAKHRAEIQRKIDANRARVEVHDGLSDEWREDKRLEAASQSERANEILDRFKAESSKPTS